MDRQSDSSQAVVFPSGCIDNTQSNGGWLSCVVYYTQSNDSV